MRNFLFILLRKTYLTRRYTGEQPKYSEKRFPYQKNIK